MGIKHAVAVLAATAMLLAATPAFAAGTGDDPTYTEDIPFEEVVEDTTLEFSDTATTLTDSLTYDLYKDSYSTETTDTTSDVTTQVITAPYKYFFTPSHAQEKSYWCGPASVQIIDDYWGTAASQSTIARYLGTTTAGTDFSKVDDALRYFTGRRYVYRTCTSTSDFYSAVQYGMLNRGNPLIADVTIDGSVWDHYVYDHAGHIVPIEAFDWRWGKLRLNDPYNEKWWRVGGGYTYGHQTYPKTQIALGVMSHFRKAIVY